MKKLKLSLDDLRVESFSATPDPAQKRGTVFGQYETEYPWDCTVHTCNNQETCPPYDTCGGTGCGSEGATCTCGTSAETCWNSIGYCEYTCDPDCTKTTDVLPQCTTPQQIC